MPCTTILVGKKASYDGSTMIARNDDGFYDVKKLIVVPPNTANEFSAYALLPTMWSALSLPP